MRKVLGIYNKTTNLIQYIYVDEAENISGFNEMLLKNYTDPFIVKKLIDLGDLILVNKPTGYGCDEIRISNSLYSLHYEEKKPYETTSFYQLHRKNEKNIIYIYDISSMEWLISKECSNTNPFMVKDGICYYRIKDILREEQVKSFVSLGQILEFALQKEDKEKYNKLLNLSKGFYVTKEQLDNDNLTKMDKKRIGKILALLKK